MYKIRFLVFLLAFALIMPTAAVFAESTAPVETAAEVQAENTQDTETVLDAPQAEEPDTIAAAAAALNLHAQSAILVEQSTGKVLYEMNPDERMAPASITKVMTLLLVMEAIESGKIKLEDMASCSQHAESFGGSQIWLEVNEQMSINDLLKAVTIASANDAAVLLAEVVGGTEETFVAMMNERAKQLGMTNTTFMNASGLDAEGHLTTARDISIMSRELLRHDLIKEYSTVWMDKLRNGETELTNTNRMVRFYDGATGLKTGTTNDAKSCLSASATRGGMSLVAVSLGSATSDERFDCARKLLDFGFANFSLAVPPDATGKLLPVKVIGGTERFVELMYETPGAVVIKAGDEQKITTEVKLAEDLHAPVDKGQNIGEITIFYDGAEAAKYPVKAKNAVEDMTFFRALSRLCMELIKLK